MIKNHICRIHKLESNKLRERIASGDAFLGLSLFFLLFSSLSFFFKVRGVLKKRTDGRA